MYSAKTGKYIGSHTEISYYLQINWGWNAKSDGFYLQGAYDLRNGPDLDEDRGLFGENQHNFTTGFQIYYGMRKIDSKQ